MHPSLDQLKEVWPDTAEFPFQFPRLFLGAPAVTLQRDESLDSDFDSVLLHFTKGSGSDLLKGRRCFSASHACGSFLSRNTPLAGFTSSPIVYLGGMTYPVSL